MLARLLSNTQKFTVINIKHVRRQEKRKWAGIAKDKESSMDIYLGIEKTFYREPYFFWVLS